MAPRSWMAVWSQAVQVCLTRPPARWIRLALEPLEDRRTPTSVSLVKDIVAGAGASIPGNFVHVNGTLFFTADYGNTGRELWKSDGTAAGTVLVKDIRPGAGSSNLRYLTAVNGTLFFRATDGTNGDELWKSDGTTAGTVLVQDIRPGTASSDPRYLTSVNGTLFFRATDGTNGSELWKSDGTEAGTVMVKDIRPGTPATSSGAQGLTNVNGILFFRAEDGSTGTELWKSDGTEAGTVMVKDINPSGGSFPGSLTNVNGTLFFSADDGTNGFELWKSDGTAAGTILVKDIYPGVYGSVPHYLAEVNGILFFRAADATHGFELWKSDGTVAGTILVKDIVPATYYGSFPRFLTNINSKLFFQLGSGGGELWESDGTETGTVLAKINLTTGSSPQFVTNVNGTLFFSANSGTTGRELWRSDGTAAGTVLVRDITPGANSSVPRALTNVNGTLFFTADDGIHGRELWKATEFSDDFNRAEGTNLGTAWTERPGDLAVLGNKLVAVGPSVSTAMAAGVTLADVRVEAEVSVLTTGNSKAELLLRAQSPTAAYFGSLVGNNGVVTAYIRKGTKTLASAAVTAPLGTGVLRFEAAGSLLKLFFNDTLVASAIDSTYKSGKVGVRGTQFVTFDDFFVSPVDPELPFGDSFDRNVDSTSLGSQWREQAGDLAVIGNQVTALGTGGNVGIYQWGAAKNVSVQANVNVFSPAGSGLTGSAGLIARYTGTADKNYYLGAIYGVNGVFTARIYRNSPLSASGAIRSRVNGVFTAPSDRNVNGALTQLASASVSSGSGLLRLEVIGNSLKLFVNGVLAVKTTDTRLTGPGQVGVRGTPRSTFDTFNAKQVFPTLFYDGFNRADAADLGPEWKAVKGGVGIVTNQASATTAGTNVAVRDGVPLKEVILEAKVTVLGVGVSEAGLVARVKDANNYYYAALDGNAGSYSVSIYKVVGNVKTQIGAAAAVGSNTGTLRFEVTGNSLKLYFNGALLVNVTDSKFTAAGLAGLRGTLNTGFDDFTTA